MPNTLAHMGVQGLLSRGVFRGSDLKWVYLGCILPDFPWIWRRIALLLYPSFDESAYSLAVPIQASLVLSLVLAAACSLIARDSRRTFQLLSLNVFLHLLLDSLQTKWGNGVHLFAPLDWKLLNFGLFWPDSLPTYFLTAAGAVLFVAGWRDTTGRRAEIVTPSVKRTIAALLLALLYFLLPVPLIGPYISSDSHYVKTLMERELRPGRFVEFDRIEYENHSGEKFLRLGDEALPVTGNLPDASGRLAIRGVFLRADLLEVKEYHRHNPMFRDNATHAGLLFILLVWAASLLKGKTLVKREEEG